MCIVRQRHETLTGEIIVKLEWGHVPEDDDVTPGLAQWDHLFAATPGLSILLCANQTSGQVPIPDLKQVAGIVPDPHWSMREKTEFNHSTGHKDRQNALWFT